MAKRLDQNDRLRKPMGTLGNMAKNYEFIFSKFEIYFLSIFNIRRATPGTLATRYIIFQIDGK